MILTFKTQVIQEVTLGQTLFRTQSPNVVTVSRKLICFGFSVFYSIVLNNFAYLDICFLRLDFETLNIQGPSVTDETDGGVCVDSLKITVNNNSSIFFIQISIQTLNEFFLGELWPNNT